MKNNTVKAVAVVLLSILLSLPIGCFFQNAIADGPGMVNYQGLLLQVLTGDWESDGDGSYRITFWDDSTFSMSYLYEPVIDSAALTLYTASTNTDEYSAFDISPRVFTDEAGNSVEITKASHENGTVTLELTASDGEMATVLFHRVPDHDAPELLDGPGMYHYGRVLDEAITGSWTSADGRFTLDFDGKYADFAADGNLLTSKDDGYFVDHSYLAEGNLDERCELVPTGSYLDDTEEPPFTISEMWYQSEQIYMIIRWSDGKADEIVFSKVDEAMPEGE